MARRNDVRNQWVTYSNEQRAISNAQRYNAFLRQRIERLRAEIENYRARVWAEIEYYRTGNHEMDMSIILHDLVEDRRRHPKDLPLDIALDVVRLADEHIRRASDILNNKLEAAAQEPPAEGAPPLFCRECGCALGHGR